MGKQAGLRIQLLGAFQVWRGQTPIPPSAWRRKTQAVLKVLAGERGRVFSQDELVEGLFPDLVADKAVQNLHARISELRRALEPGLRRGTDSRYVQSVGRGRYRLPDEADCRIDLEEFFQAAAVAAERAEAGRWGEALVCAQRAVELCGGEYLAEDRYEAWAQTAHRRWRQRWLDALALLAEAHGQLGRPDAAIDVLQRALDVDPCRESFVRALMRQQAAAGERGAVRRTYAACVRALARELQVQPDRRTRALYEQLMQEVPTAGFVRVSPVERNRSRSTPTTTPAAHRCYLKGRYFWNRRGGGELLKAVDCFQEAIRLEPAYAEAHAALADAYTILAWWDHRPAHEMFEHARQAAQRAIELDDSLAEAHAALAYAQMNHRWAWRAAERGLRRALQLNPNCAIALHWRGEFLAATGHLEDALAALRRALALDPLSLILNTVLAWQLVFAGDLAGALDQCRQALELDGRFGPAHSVLGQIRERQGRYAEAVRVFEAELDLAGATHTHTLASLGHACGLAGRDGAARRILKTLERMRGTRRASAYHLGLVHLGLGETAAALDAFEAAFEERFWLLIYLGVCPRFEPLRGEPRFRALVRELGMPARGPDGQGLRV